MPRATRKSKIPLNPNPVKKTSTLPAVVMSLAAEYEIDPEALLDWKVYPSGKVVLIAPNGMKLMREMDAPESPHPATEDRQVAPVDANAATDVAVSGGAHDR
ncbi:MAG: hypothetical protein CVU41_12625 [Chloroflexi bacterium HGW-Chloroflexi-3]|nr:MAG: hypothetical protein CVU41_12625 [Chloroflexi bacterium HGW-Chloroflexi-3]